MHLDKEKVDNLINEFSLLSSKNLIDKKNLSKFNLTKKEDQMYLSFIQSSDQYYINFLNFLITKTKPVNIVELGSREGLSTLSMYDAAKKIGASFYSIDIEKDQRYCPQHMFSDKQMHFLFGDVCSLSIIKQLPKNIDILFTDTLHFDFQLRDEWEIYQHLLSDIAIIAIDDINVNDKRKLFDEVPFSKWDLTELCHANGWGLFLFERKVQQTEEEQEHELLKSVISVWERKYETLFKRLESVENNQILRRIKNFFKKIKPLYMLYTKTYNYVYHKFGKNKKIRYFSESVRL
jgi:predicted O-methyltransferase YrrM